MRSALAIATALAITSCKKPSPTTSTGSGSSTPPVGSADTGSAGSADAPPIPDGSPASAAPVDAEPKARGVLQAQLDAIGKHDHAAFAATFVGDVTIIDPSGSNSPDGSNIELDASTPDGLKIGKLVARSTADAVWFYAEVGRYRIAELAVASEQWKVVAAAFVESHDIEPLGGNTEIRGANAALGPYPALVASPDDVAAKLAPDAIVIGPNKKQLAIGDGKTALASWKLAPMTLFGKVRVVATTTWSFVQANVDHPIDAKYTARLSVMLFAIPNADSVVLALYWAQ